MSVKKWLVMGFSGFLVLILVLASVSHIKLRKLKTAHEMIVIDFKADMLLDEAIADHFSWINKLVGMLLKDVPFEGELELNQCNFEKLFVKEIASHITSETLINAIDRTHKQLHLNAKEIGDLHRHGNKDAAVAFYVNKMVPVINDFSNELDSAQEILMRDIAERNESMDRLQNDINGLEIFVTAAALILGVLIAFLVTRSIYAVVKQLQDNVNQLTTSSREILVASEEQSAGANEQSAAVAETTSAAGELSKTSEQVGESIQRVAQAANHALAGMEKIKEAINKTSDMINFLGEKSQKISKITELIDDVADQTNLLAVNASIEAARAGEQGRGFTVVADEIRKLADSTAKSTKDISELVEIIQHEMSNAVLSMELSVGSVDEEARLAQETTEQAKEIAMNVHQQISGSKQIAEAMSNVNGAMQQISAAAKQTQTAVEGLKGMSEEMEKLIKFLG